ncbi:MAG: hypothetical protein Q8O19_03170, partial [Rectinemataceae bacterium]|nr:hypothetical protein [Rectinemataceae bacterium]
ILASDVKKTRPPSWEFPFSPEEGSGTYLIKAASALKAKEKDTGGVADIKGSGQVSVKATPGLRIKSPRQDLTYPKDWVLKVETTRDKDGDGDSHETWKTLKWKLNGNDIQPNTDVPPWTLTLNKVDTWTLEVELPDPNNPAIILASHTVSFQVKPVFVSISPNQTVVPLTPQKKITLRTTVEINGNQLPKPGAYVSWGSNKWKATVKNVEWKAITEKPACALLDPDPNNKLEATTYFNAFGAETALATVTIQVEPAKADKKVPPEIFVLPAVRADLWAVAFEIATYSAHLPDEAIENAYRSFALSKVLFRLNGNDYSWSSEPDQPPPVPAKARFPIVLHSALSEGPSAVCSALSISWTCPNNDPDTNAIYRPFFETPGPSVVTLATELKFGDNLGEIPFLKVDTAL